MGIYMYYLTILAKPSSIRVRCRPLFPKLHWSVTSPARLGRPRSVNPWFRNNMTHIFETHSIPFFHNYESYYMTHNPLTTLYMAILHVKIV